MVLVDLGPLENSDLRDGLSQGGSLQGVDAVVLMRADHRTTSPSQIGNRTATPGGITFKSENFVAD